jgi:uncharacterized protein
VKTWGYWATFGWTVLAFVAGQFVALAAMVWWRFSDLNSVMSTPFDGVLVTLFILISNPVSIGILALAAAARANPVDYLALNLTGRRYVGTALVILVVFIAICDALLYFSGHPLVTQFQSQAYNTAVAEGWLPAMLVATVLVAPAGEEIMFRGFLFRGWARSERTTWPAIIVISMLWAALHIQYDWTGILQIFVIGLFLGWVRWRSSSTLLTFFLHALFNLEGTLETILQAKYFS